MEFYDTFTEDGVFMSSEDETDVHYKGLWHKVIRVWLYDTEGNIYLIRRKSDHKLNCINELHMLSSESAASCFDRGMFDKLGTHFPATSNLKQVSMRKIKKHKVYSDSSEIKDYYFLCDYIGEFDKSANFFIFSNDTQELVKCNAKGVLNILSTRTGEVVGYKVDPSQADNEERVFITFKDIFDDNSEDVYQKYSYVVDEIMLESHKHKKVKKEEEYMRKLAEKKARDQANDEEFVSHADDNEGTDIY